MWIWRGSFGGGKDVFGGCTHLNVHGFGYLEGDVTLDGGVENFLSKLAGWADGTTSHVGGVGAVSAFGGRFAVGLGVVVFGAFPATGGIGAP